MQIEINAEEFCQFSSFNQWVSKAASWLYMDADKKKKYTLLCLDRNGNQCHIGADFMMADEKGLYPVTAYLIKRTVTAYEPD